MVASALALVVEWNAKNNLDINKLNMKLWTIAIQCPLFKEQNGYKHKHHATKYALQKIFSKMVGGWEANKYF